MSSPLPPPLRVRLFLYAVPSDVAVLASLSTQWHNPRPWDQLTEDTHYSCDLARRYAEGGGLDFPRLRAGIASRDFRKELLREMMLGLLPRVNPPIVAGSYALHAWIRASECRSLPWTTGDIDVWIANSTNSSHMSSVLETGAYALYGVVLVCGTRYDAIKKYDAQGERTPGQRDSICRVAHVSDLYFSVDDPSSVRFASKEACFSRAQRRAASACQCSALVDILVRALQAKWQRLLPKRGESVDVDVPSPYDSRKWLRRWQAAFPRMLGRVRGEHIFEAYELLRAVAGNWTPERMPGIELSAAQMHNFGKFAWYEDFLCTFCRTTEKSPPNTDKISLISVVGGRTDGRGVRTQIKDQDILNRFDIDVCRCGFYAKERKVFLTAPEVRGRIAARMATMATAASLDARAKTRMEKYKGRGFVFLG
jgi:hypothetical protein